MPPPTMTFEEADAVCSKFEDTYLFDDEAAMLSAFLDLIDECSIS